MLSAGTEVDRVNSEPRLSFQFGSRNPEFPALLDSPDDPRMQFLRVCFVRVRSAIANTDRRHWRIACHLEFGMAYDHRVKMPCLAHIIIDPLADLARRHSARNSSRP